MRFEVVSLFPEAEGLMGFGLLGKAIADARIEVAFCDPRDFTTDKHRSVDDAPYGGGSGMVLKPEPVIAALESLDAVRGEGKTHKILLSPQGQVFSQRHAERLAELPCVTFVCGRYEGFDERIRDYVDEELSLGDFVLMGGELAAVTMIDSIARLRPFVLGNADSAVFESHANHLLEHPQYTRPAEFRGARVPDVLLSGDHKKIERYRREESIRRTALRRPELLELADLSDQEREIAEGFKP